MQNVEDLTILNQNFRNKMSKKQKSSAPIVWSMKQVKAKDIQPTPGNYKIENKIGLQRFLASLGEFGLANGVVVNQSKIKGKWDLIDGNSRWKQVMARNPNELMWVSYPAKPLTPIQYKRMAAVYDDARAGDVDRDRILGELGTSKDFAAKFGYEVPMAILEKLGSKADIKDLEYPEEGNGKKSKELKTSDTRMVQLFFDEKQEKEFRDKIEPKLSKKFKADDTTTIVWRALKSIK
jgi:hypothetical protein